MPHTTPIEGCNAHILGTPTLNSPYTEIWTAILPELKNQINQITGTTPITPINKIPTKHTPFTISLLWTIDEIITKQYKTNEKYNTLKSHQTKQPINTWISPIIITTTQQNNSYGFTLTWYSDHETPSQHETNKQYNGPNIITDTKDNQPEEIICLNMNNWKQYKRKGLSEMRPYVAGEDVSRISISEPDKQNGSPRNGDMIARNPKNHADQWLVAKKYFEDNLEPA